MLKGKNKKRLIEKKTKKKIQVILGKPTNPMTMGTRLE
jgi:hypothetical protein